MTLWNCVLPGSNLSKKISNAEFMPDTNNTAAHYADIRAVLERRGALIGVNDSLIGLVGK